jgi:hypothetical protein
VPWASIRQVVLAPAGPDAVEVGIRLWPAAPLPDGVPAVVFDPRQPRAVQIRRRFRAGRLDPQRFLGRVRAFAGPAVVARVEAEFPPLRPPAPGAGRTPDQAPGTVIAVRFRTGGRMYLHTPSLRGTDYRYRFKPHPVVRFDLPDGRTVVAETGAPASGDPGARVLVTYDAADPTDVRVAGPRPRARWLRTA